MFDRLPTEINQIITFQLDIFDRFALSLTCKQFYGTAEEHKELIVSLANKLSISEGDNHIRIFCQIMCWWVKKYKPHKLNTLNPLNKLFSSLTQTTDNISAFSKIIDMLGDSNNLTLIWIKKTIMEIFVGSEKILVRKFNSDKSMSRVRIVFAEGNYDLIKIIMKLHLKKCYQPVLLVLQGIVRRVENGDKKSVLFLLDNAVNQLKKYPDIESEENYAHYLNRAYEVALLYGHKNIALLIQSYV